MSKLAALVPALLALVLYLGFVQGRDEWRSLPPTEGPPVAGSPCPGRNCAGGRV